MSDRSESTETVPELGSDALFSTDPRVAFLMEEDAEILFSLMKEVAFPADLGCSRNFFLVGMDPRFRETEPEELFDLIAGVLKARQPDTVES